MHVEVISGESTTFGFTRDESKYFRINNCYFSLPLKVREISILFINTFFKDFSDLLFLRIFFMATMN